MVSDNLLLIWLFLFLIPPVVAGITSSLLNFALPTFVIYLVMGVGFVLGFLVLRWRNCQIKLYQVESAEWLNYHVYPALTNTQRYLLKKQVSPEMKENYRKEAIKNLIELAKVIKERWIVGDFKLAKDIVGTPVEDLQNALNLWVIPTLEEEGRNKDEDKIKRTEAFLTSLYWLSKNLNLKELEDINSKAKENYKKPVLEEKKGLWESIKASKSAKLIIPLVVIITVYLVSVYYLITFEKWSIVDANTAAGFFFGIILAAIALFRRERPP